MPGIIFLPYRPRIPHDVGVGVMEQSLHCQILIEGQLTNEWSDWFGGLSIENLPDGNGVLQGMLPDQTALYGVIDRLLDLGLVLLSVDCAETPEELHPIRPVEDAMSEKMS